jgi:hypothetical protein
MSVIRSLTGGKPDMRWISRKRISYFRSLGKSGCDYGRTDAGLVALPWYARSPNSKDPETNIP